MGIQGLLPFLKKIHTPVNISQFRGCTVAIDAYCWLHKGAFSCAEKLALGEKTQQYVYYCMKYVDCLLRNGLKPILVFDGCHLPSKKDVEVSRRERRELNRKKAAQLLREGRRAEAKECLQRCVDITSRMALELMNVCRAQGVDCIVAPYEADAQLAYLNKAGIAQLIITEDSDLLLFGCEKVIFKMDFFGNGVLIEQRRLNEVVEIQDGFYTFEKFRYLCILSGCDYLPSLPGIGLAKACKVFKVARQADIRQLLRKLPSYLKMSLVVTEDYIDGFIRADNTFLYQLAFDPMTRKLCPLTPYSPEVEIEALRYAGPYFSNQLALEIALGNVDIHTQERIGDFDPKTYIPKHAKQQDQERQHMISIWSQAYQADPTRAVWKAGAEEVDTPRPCLTGKEVQVKNTLKKRSPVKRVRQVADSQDVKTDTELTDLYSSAPKDHKRRRGDTEEIVHQSSVPAGTKRPKHSDGDDSDEDNRSWHTAKKQVLSPSKTSNQLPRRPIRTADDAFSLIDEVSTVAVSPQGKENGQKAVTTPKRNKFAVSALAKRAKFSLDTAALPNIRVEVKSRYFTSGSASSLPAPESRRAEDGSRSGGKETSTLSSKQKQEEPSLENGRLSSPERHQQSVDKSSSKENGGVSPVSPFVPAKDTAFGYSADGKNTGLQATKTKSNLRQASSSSQPKAKSCKASDKLSPGSAFSWSSFQFQKSASSSSLSSFMHTSTGSNKPFKQVLTGDRQVLTGDKPDAEDVSSPTPDFANSQGDKSKVSQYSGDDSADIFLSGITCTTPRDGGDGDGVSDMGASQHSSPVDREASRHSSPVDREASQHSSPVDREASQRSSLVDREASQRSQLYSIDSDCLPTSQDVVDLTDCCDSVCGNSGTTSDWASPASSSQSSLQTPRSTPKTTSGAGGKKCRVPGLSRGKKKTPEVDEKQQKIRDMFSRFAHKQPKLDPLPDASTEDVTCPASATPPSLLHNSTEAHRRLVL